VLPYLIERRMKPALKRFLEHKQGAADANEEKNNPGEQTKPAVKREKILFHLPKI
jgi:hypothetical protein